MKPEERCKEKVFPNDQWGAFHPHQCEKKAVKDGYCKIHHPDYIEAKRKAKSEKWDQDWEKKQKKWRLESFAPVLLACLKAIINDLPTNRDWMNPDIEKLARDAIAKAEGKE